MNLIGERLRAARTARGLTQERLAAGIATKGFICQIERNQVTPSLQRLRLLADRLGLPLAYFLEAPPPASGDYLIKAAELAVKAGEARRAIALLDEIAEDELSADERANAGRLRGTALLASGQKSEGLRTLQEAAASAPPDDPMLSAAIYAEIGSALGEQELFSASIEASLRALQWLDRSRHPDLDLKAHVLTNIANVWYRWGKTAEAVGYYEKALTAATDGESLLRMANAHMALGVAARAMGQLHAAVRHCEQALVIHRRLGRERLANQVLNNLGDAYYAQGKVEEARQLQQECLDRGHRSKDYVAVAAAASQLARFALAEGHLDDAIARSTEAEQAAQRANSYLYQARAVVLRGMAAERQGRRQVCDRAFRQAFEILKQGGALAEMGDACARYSDVLRERSDADGALRFMRIAYERDFGDLASALRAVRRHN
jgi:tetratricopeptide (TPR) repeat protein